MPKYAQYLGTRNFNDNNVRCHPGLAVMGLKIGGIYEIIEEIGPGNYRIIKPKKSNVSSTIGIGSDHRDIIEVFDSLND